MPQSDKIISVQSLSKSYPLGKEKLEVLFNINMSIRYGDFAAIMGPSGSGKSTLLNILGCLDTPTSGEYFLNQKPVNGMSPNQLAAIRNHDIGFVFQNFNLLPKLDVYSNVELPLIYGNTPKKKRREKVEHILNELGLWNRRSHRPNEISGGQKQRVALARALVKSPAIILADEPTGNLDSTTTEEILNLFSELNQLGNTILVITHEVEVAQRANFVYTIHDGRLAKK